MKKEDFKNLLEKYSKGECSAEEIKSVESYILKNPIVKNWQWKDLQSKEETNRTIREGLPMLRQPRTSLRGMMLWGISAAVALIVMTGIWMLGTKHTMVDSPGQVIVKALEYSSDQVTITLPNGEVRTLHGKLSSADLQLFPHELKDSTELEWLTVQVPNGKFQELVLPDGSSVWLNAGSKLRFPRIFTKNNRDVYLQGEGYFDVVHAPTKPFHVFVGASKIEVTGTQFNVQAFGEDGVVRTSLVKGGVTYTSNYESHKIAPGYELISDLGGKPSIYQKFNVNQVTSWKDGYFTFDNMSLIEVMKMVSRWYNISVVSDIKIDSLKIGGTYPMDLPIKELLEDISIISGIQFEIEGKEVRIVKSLTKKNF